MVNKSRWAKKMICQSIIYDVREAWKVSCFSFVRATMCERTKESEYREEKRTFFENNITKRG